MRKIWLAILIAASVLAGCSPPAIDPSPIPFAPPAVIITPTPASTPLPTAVPASPTPDCSDGLRFLDDLTIPDGTAVGPGEVLDKRWLVENSGTCNWDERYSLELVTGAEMGSTSPQRLFPALAGAEAEIRILFTAPGEPGIYRSAWQAFGPGGQAFGDPIFIEVVVP